MDSRTHTGAASSNEPGAGRRRRSIGTTHLALLLLLGSCFVACGDDGDAEQNIVRGPGNTGGAPSAEVPDNTSGMHGEASNSSSAGAGASATGEAGTGGATHATEPDSEAPETVPDAAKTARGVPVIIDVIANDLHAAEARITAWTEGEHGAVLLRPDGKLVYRPESGFDGEDHFSYSLGEDVTGEVRVIVLPFSGVVVDERLFTELELTPGPISGITSDITGLVPNDMNTKGQIVGALDVAHPERSFNQRAFLREADGTYVLIEMPTELVYQSSDARGINDAGLVSGTYVDESGKWRSFLWDSTGEDAPLLFDVPEADQTYAGKLNNLGEVTGYAGLGGVLSGFVRDPDGAFTTFHVAGEEEATYAWGIDDSQRVWGSAGFSRGFERARDGAVSFLVPENPDGTPSASAWIRGVNTAGDRVGNYSEGERTSALFLTKEGAQVSVRLQPEDAGGYDILTDIEDDGTLLAWSNQGGKNHGLLLKPVEAEPNTSFEAP